MKHGLVVVHHKRLAFRVAAEVHVPAHGEVRDFIRLPVTIWARLTKVRYRREHKGFVHSG